MCIRDSNKCFSLSNDYGENWTRIEPDVPFDFLYQPYLLALDGGRLGLYGHVLSLIHISILRF